MDSTYMIKEGNSIAFADGWVVLVDTVLCWYDYLSFSDYGLEDIPYPQEISEMLDLDEPDLDGLNGAISEWEDEIAKAAGYKTFSGHGSYTVSPSSQMGISMSVTEE